MTKIIFFLGLLLWTQPSYAVSEQAICRILEQQKKTAPADYVPGVDVKGQSVVPANVSAPIKIVPDVVKFPLTIDLAEEIQALTEYNINMDAPLGLVEVHPDGLIKYNGQDWTEETRIFCEGDIAVPKAVASPEMPSPEVLRVMEESNEGIMINEDINEEEKIYTNRPDIMEKIEGGEYRDHIDE